MQVKEFLTIPEKNIVYEIPDTSAEFADIFKNGSNHPDEADDSSEMEIIPDEIYVVVNLREYEKKD